MPGLYPALSAREHLEFFCALQAVPRTRIAEVLAETALDHVADRPASQLSRGMQQRVALARAILHNPPLLILDEPDAGLDANAADLLALVMEGRSVVMATHDQQLAARLCGRTLILDGGRAVDPSQRLRVLQ